jgi:hypothetical protein
MRLPEREICFTHQGIREFSNRCKTRHRALMQMLDINVKRFITVVYNLRIPTEVSRLPNSMGKICLQYLAYRQMGYCGTAL